MPVGEQRKSILYWAPGRASLPDLRARLLRAPGASPGEGGDGARPASLSAGSIELVFHAEERPGVLLDRLHREYFNLVVLDLRCAPHRFAAVVEEAEGLLETMASEPDIEARYGFHRVVALLSGEGDAVDRLIARLGARQVGRVLRGPPPGSSTSSRASDEFSRVCLSEMLRLLLERRPGLMALCCAGGGITGINFELGALKCLDDCLLPRGATNQFDLYFGISAGAVVNALLANDYSIDDCLAAIAGAGTGKIPPISLSIVRLNMLDAASLRDRMVHGVKLLAQALWTQGTHFHPLDMLESLLLDYTDLFGPPLKGDHFESTIRTLLTAPGRSNDFRTMSRRLFVGATDQDLRRHVLFGSPGHDDVPVSLAVQASSALHPAFASTRIKDRYYCDGAVTATSHMHEAIRMGADLLFVVDPFLPYVSKEPGYARARGLLYNIDQDVRTLSYTRFERMREAALRHHPSVSSYTFLPQNSLRRLLSVNPMDHRAYLPIWRGAYLSTLVRVQRLRHRLVGDLALHGLVLDTSRAEEVAERLRETRAPVLGDFYPDGRRELHEAATPRMAPLPRPPEHSPLAL